MLRLLKATPGNHRDLFPFSFIKTCKIGQGRKNMRTFLSERRNTRICRGTPRVLLYYSKNSSYLALTFHSQHPADFSSSSVVFKNSTEFHGLRMQYVTKKHSKASPLWVREPEKVHLISVKSSKMGPEVTWEEFASRLEPGKALFVGFFTHGEYPNL